MVKEIVKLLSMYDNQLFKKKALLKTLSMYDNQWFGKKSSRYHGCIFFFFFFLFVSNEAEAVDLFTIKKSGKFE